MEKSDDPSADHRQPDVEIALQNERKTGDQMYEDKPLLALTGLVTLAVA